MSLTDSNFKWMKFFFAFQIFSIWLEFPDKLLKCVKGLWNIPTLPAMFVVKTSAMTGSAHQTSSLTAYVHAGTLILLSVRSFLSVNGRPIIHQQHGVNG